MMGDDGKEPMKISYKRKIITKKKGIHDTERNGDDSKNSKKKKLKNLENEINL